MRCRKPLQRGACSGTSFAQVVGGEPLDRAAARGGRCLWQGSRADADARLGFPSHRVALSRFLLTGPAVRKLLPGRPTLTLHRQAPPTLRLSTSWRGGTSACESLTAVRLVVLPRPRGSKRHCMCVSRPTRHWRRPSWACLAFQCLCLRSQPAAVSNHAGEPEELAHEDQFVMLHDLVHAMVDDLPAPGRADRIMPAAFDEPVPARTIAHGGPLPRRTLSSSRPPLVLRAGPLARGRCSGCRCQ